MEKPLVDNDYVIEKMLGKGGWSYVVISEIPPENKARGLVRVRGFIDAYQIKQFNLMPMKDGNMFLPLKKEVRKKIRKEEGDTVHVILYADNSTVEIPDEIMVCLLESPKAHQFFLSLSESYQKNYIDWIIEPKRLETKIERMAKTIERLENGLKFYGW